MPSGSASSGNRAQSRGSTSAPSAAIVSSVSTRVPLSATIIVTPSGWMTMPLGNHKPAAAVDTVPSAVTRAMLAVQGEMGWVSISKPKLPT
jgi:hypothetical protein